MPDTVGKDDIDRGTETLEDLDLEHRALELGEIHEPLAHTGLSELDDESQHVGDTLTGVSRSGHQTDVSAHFLMSVVTALR